MNYLSVCSGVEAATVAWHHLGWKPVGFSEIEKFPSQVLKHHYPDIKNYGDFTTLKTMPEVLKEVDLFVGGTPCQAFSLAGLRESLSSNNGNLALEYVRLANAIDDIRHSLRKEPSFHLWENVPGVLSTSDNAFGYFLAGMAGSDAPIEAPEKWTNAGVVSGERRVVAWRVLDAQYFGVPQRRRRVFVLALGGSRAWRSADALLPICKGVQRNTPPFQTERERASAKTQKSFRRKSSYVGNAEGGNRDLPNLTKQNTGGAGISNQTNLVAVYENHPNDSRITEVGETAPTVTSRFGTGGGNIPLVQSKLNLDEAPQIASTLTAELQKQVTNQMITDAGSFFFPVETKGYRMTAFGEYDDDETGSTMKARDYKDATDLVCIDRGAMHAGYESKHSFDISERETANTLIAAGPHAVYHKTEVRRLTPEECELLQGFPKGYTDIKPKGKNTPDAPRYKAMGNSMAVPVMKWIGERIKKVMA